MCGYEDSWVEWYKDKMIIGPPRSRSAREEAVLDEDYLTRSLPWVQRPVS